MIIYGDWYGFTCACVFRECEVQNPPVTVEWTQKHFTGSLFPINQRKNKRPKPISVLAFKSVLRGWTVHLNVINKKPSFVKTRERCSKNMSDEIKHNVSDWHEQLPKTPAVYNNYTLALERMHLVQFIKKIICVHKPGWTIHSQTEQNDLFTNWIEICSQIRKKHSFTFHFQDKFFQQIRLNY